MVAGREGLEEGRTALRRFMFMLAKPVFSGSFSLFLL
ncbi:MAG: hypothetical protein H6R19_673 [Proteobacteria bacterium]|nr:hypothetical protein [Pseudomonadota bacterium]